MREDGSVPVELAAGVGLLLMPAALLVLSFGPWLQTRTLVRAAAAEAARSVVLAEPAGSGEPDARRLVEQMATNAGLRDDSVEVWFCEGTCAPIQRGDLVTVRVTAPVPLIQTPLGSVGGLTVSAVHSEWVDLYRSFP